MKKIGFQPAARVMTQSKCMHILLTDKVNCQLLRIGWQEFGADATGSEEKAEACEEAPPTMCGCQCLLELGLFQGQAL